MDRERYRALRGGGSPRRPATLRGESSRTDPRRSQRCRAQSDTGHRRGRSGRAGTATGRQPDGATCRSESGESSARVARATETSLAQLCFIELRTRSSDLQRVSDTGPDRRPRAALGAGPGRGWRGAPGGFGDSAPRTSRRAAAPLPARFSLRSRAPPVGPTRDAPPSRAFFSCWRSRSSTRRARPGRDGVRVRGTHSSSTAARSEHGWESGPLFWNRPSTRRFARTGGAVGKPRVA